MTEYTGQLEEVRERIEDTSRCYHMLDKVWCYHMLYKVWCYHLLDKVWCYHMLDMVWCYYMLGMVENVGQCIVQRIYLKLSDESFY